MQNPVFLSSYLFIAQSAPFNFTHTPTSYLAEKHRLQFATQ